MGKYSSVSVDWWVSRLLGASVRVRELVGPNNNNTTHP